MHATRKSKAQYWGLAAVLGMLLVVFLSPSRWMTDKPPFTKPAPVEREEERVGAADHPVSKSALPTRRTQATREAEQASLDWIEQMLLDELSADSRLLAIEQLRMIESPASVQSLAGLLGDADPIVREQAIHALGEKGLAAVPALGQAMISDPNAALREQAIDLLAEIDGPASTAMLRYASMHDPLQHLRDQAGVLLEERPAPEALEPVTPSKGWEFYADDFQASWFMPEGNAIELLSGIYEEASVEDIRRQALTELALLGGERSVEPLSRGLNDPSQEIRVETLNLLADHPDNTLHLLGQALIGDRDPFVRAEALELVAGFATPAADALVLLGTEDDDEKVRARALELVAEH